MNELFVLNLSMYGKKGSHYNFPVFWKDASAVSIFQV